MPRVRARTDGNHAQMGAWARTLFPVVKDTHQYGGGMSDYLVKTHRGTVFLMEVKDPAQPPSGRRLTPDQVKWKSDFGDSFRVVETLDDLVSLSRL